MSLKDFKRTIKEEKEDAVQHYNNAKNKNRNTKAEYYKSRIDAFEYCLKKLNDEILLSDIKNPNGECKHLNKYWKNMNDDSMFCPDCKTYT